MWEDKVKIHLLATNLAKEVFSNNIDVTQLNG